MNLSPNAEAEKLRERRATEETTMSTEEAEHADITATGVRINGKPFPYYIDQRGPSAESIGGGFHIVNIPVLVTGTMNISPDAAKKRAEYLLNGTEWRPGTSSAAGFHRGRGARSRQPAAREGAAGGFLFASQKLRSGGFWLASAEFTDCKRARDGSVKDLTTLPCPNQ
ncbi:hypothetical protein ACWDKQ_17055 [Saccharopolyspora sp. NPDC000995]